MLRFVAFEPVIKAKKLKSKVKNAYKAKKVDALARRMQKIVALDFVRGLKTFKKRISREKLEKAWESGLYHELDRFIPWNDLHEDLAPMSKKMKETMFEASLVGLTHLPPPAKNLRWDIKNPKIRHYIDHRTGELIKGITLDGKSLVKRIVARSFTHAMTPREVANEIKGSIGLHERYSNALRNFQLDLIRRGESMDKVQDKTEKYEERLLKSRSMTIARTETRQASNHGQRSVWREAAEQGFFKKDEAKRIWVVDGNPCEICEPMDEEEATLDGSYFSEVLGEEVEPGDVHPNCECIEILEFE